MSSFTATLDSIDSNADDEMVATLVTDDGVSIVIPLALLPEGCHEGDVLTLTLERQPDETSARRRRISDLQKRLFG